MQTEPLVFTFDGFHLLAYIKMELYGAAMRDADEAIRLDPSYIKAYYRRAVSNMGLGKLKGSYENLFKFTRCCQGF
jgi:serine/threonine-protein phosphatase 5